MKSYLGGGQDSAFLDDILIKDGPLGKWEEKLDNDESPKDWFDGWDAADPSSTFTADCGDWRAHYRAKYPLVFYHEKKFVFGVRKPPTIVRIDQNTENIVWARINGNVVLERDDYPRFTTRDGVKFSHTPKVTDLPNVFRLGNGYSIACSKRVAPLEFGAETMGEAWWMVGPTEEEEELSKRVLMIKVYDGPFQYQARGTDIRLSDPAPLSTISEYLIYSYDDEGLKGIHRENYKGVAPQKHAMTLRGEDFLNQIREKEGKIGFRDNQVTGPGKIRLLFPLGATKLLKLEWRGSEIEYRMRPDETDWVTMENYDGRAVTNLEVEFDVYNSLASLRLEWESLKDWLPVGRPKIDLLPAGWGGNLIKMEVEDGEGISQTNNLYTGAYTVSANVRCHEGIALVDVGGIEVVNWNPLDKSVRGSGDFVANNDLYEFTITGRKNAVFEIDRFRVAEAGQTDWVPKDMDWYVETEIGKFPASESINNPEVPVAIGEAKRWRIGVDVPTNLGGIPEIAVSGIYNKTFRTGTSQILKQIRWSGSGKSRIYYPQNVTSLPVRGNYVEIDGRGALTWEQEVSFDEGDVKLLLDGSLVAYREEYTYRPVTLKNRRWRVEIGENRADVFLDGLNVGFMLGQSLPFRVTQNNTEDVQLDCSVGFIQLRREMGPRFEGWDVGNANTEIASDGPRVAWGASQDEAKENVPYYGVRVGR